MDVNNEDNVVDACSPIPLISSKYMTYPYALITKTNLAGYQQFFHGTSRKPKDNIINYGNNVVEAFFKYLFVTMYSHQSGWSLADKATSYLLVKRVLNHWIRLSGMDRI